MSDATATKWVLAFRGALLQQLIAGRTEGYALGYAEAFADAFCEALTEGFVEGRLAERDRLRALRRANAGQSAEAQEWLAALALGCDDVELPCQTPLLQ